MFVNLRALWIIEINCQADNLIANQIVVKQV